MTGTLKFVDLGLPEEGISVTYLMKDSEIELLKQEIERTGIAEIMEIRPAETTTAEEIIKEHAIC